MKYLVLVVISIIVQPLTAQTNLVPNPSFEDTVVCPEFSGDMPLGWSSFAYSPDYYNFCANTSSCCFGVPNNWLGYQATHYGNAYMGVLTYDGTSPSSNREYIGALLTTPLIQGTKYFVNFFISRASKTPCTCSSNKFGVKFSTHSYSASTPLEPNNYAHIHSETIINDTTNWVKISGSFVADSAYTYLIAGNFFDNANTTATGCVSSGAYYYIDDLCVSTDSSFCAGFNDIIEQNTFDVFSIYPNPSFGMVTIKTSNLTEKGYLKIYNTIGQTLYQSEINSTYTEINTTGISKGIFLLEIIYKNKKTTYKLISQ